MMLAKNVTMKRILSSFLVLVMVLGLLPVSVFAAGNGSAWQVGDYKGYNAETGASNGMSYSTKEEATQVLQDDGITMQKNITGTGTENLFNIELVVTTEEQLAEVPMSPDAAVVLVIDASNSMNYNDAGCDVYCYNNDFGYGEYPDGRYMTRMSHEDYHENSGTSYYAAWPIEGERRITKAKAAAVNFVDDFVKDAGDAKRMISVVSFNKDAETEIRWTESNVELNPINEWKDDIQDVKDAINEIEMDGSTNIEAGLKKAYDLLGSTDIQGIKSKYVILLTDGAPTMSNHDSSESVQEYAEDAAEVAENIRIERQATLYTLAYAVGNEELYGGEVEWQEVTHTCNKTGWHQHNWYERNENGYGSGKDGQLKNGRFQECDHWGFCSCTSGWFNGSHTGTTEEKVQGGGVTVGEWLENDIASDGCAYNATTGDEISISLTNIIETISKLMQAWQVNDPMGTYMKNPEITSSKGKDVVSIDDNGTILWNLWLDTPTKSGSQIYTYKLAYQVELDTAIEGFAEETFYETNRPTSLKYAVNLLNDDGTLNVNADIQVAYFNIPTVQGTIPEYTYKVEYYQQQNATKGDYEHYTKIDADTDTGPMTDLWTSVEIQNVDAGYRTKYASDHYHYAKGEPASITISPVEANNVIRLYYDRDTAAVTVNHYYRTDVTDVDGNKTVGTYGTPDTDTVTAYVGDRYPESGEVTLKTQNGLYTLVTSMDEAELVSDSRYIDSISENGNTINLYYVQHIDNRLKASVTLQKNYETWEWQINEATGRYELKKIEDKPGTPEVVVNETRIPANHTQNIPDETGYTVESITANGTDTTRNGEGNITFALQQGANSIVVTYKKVIDNRGEPVDVTINHYYTQHNYTSNGNGLEDNRDPDNELGCTVTVQRYVGETFDFVEDTDSEGFKTTYENALYEAKTTAPEAFTVTADGATLNISYERSVYPGQATFTVNNYFRTWISVIDTQTGEVSWELSSTDFTDTKTYPLEGSGETYYVGQTHTVPTNPEGRTGYTQDLMADESGVTSDETITLSDGANEANVYFDKKNGEEPTSAYVQVIHKYYQEVETVKEGVVTTEKRYEGESTVKEYGSVGTTYSITPVLEYNGNSYQRNDDVSLTTSYNNGTVILTYIRHGDSDLTATDLTVTHNYFVKNMTVENGVAGYYDDPVSEGSSTDYVVKDKNGSVITDYSKLYVGMEVTVELAPDHNGQAYTARTNNPATTLTLGDAGTNSLVLNYDRQNPLDKVEVTVDHTYLEYVYSYQNGVESMETISTMGTQTKVEKYVGESYTATPVPNGYTLTSAKDGENDIVPTEGAYVVAVGESGNSIHFVYEKNTGKRTPATVTVYHYYTEIDWDGTVTGCGTSGYEAETDGTVSSYAGLTYTATPKLKADDNGENGYTLVDQNSTPAFDNGLTITLQEGANEIHLYYEKHIDTREATQVKVIHNYYARDTYTVDGALSDADYITQENVKPEYQTEHVYNSFEDGVWVGQEYTAAMYNIVYFKDEDGNASIERVYDLVNATPEGGKIASIAALDEGNIPDGNIVIFNLIRDYSTDPGDATYTVIHQYYTNGSLIGSTERTVSGKVGATVNAADIAKETIYGGNTYSYTSADKENLTLVADAKDNVITLRYDRTTGGGGGTTSYYNVIVNYYDQDTGEKIADSHSERLSSGSRYDVSKYDAIEIEGYTYEKTTGDALTGIVNSNKTINVYYTAGSSIEEPETPLGPEPSEEPSPEPSDEPSVEIPEETTPLGPGPEEPSPEPSDEPSVEIPEDGTPLGDLPQTGAVAAPVNPAITMGLMALAFSMAGCGLYFTFGRKKGEEED